MMILRSSKMMLNNGIIVRAVKVEECSNKEYVLVAPLLTAEEVKLL
jgi:hypothetical protein